MNIKNLLFVSAFFPPSVGGPATFVSSIGPEFINLGCNVSYANLEPYKTVSKFKQKLFFIRDFWKKSKSVDLVIICDTWSVLIPAVLLSILRRKKYVVRIGGDFLWETHISRTKDHMKLSLFYSPLPTLTLKESIIYFLTRFSLKHAQAVIFNTSWQQDIWQAPYDLQKEKTFVVENAIVTGNTLYTWNISKQKIIRCPVRASEFKNTEVLKKVWTRLSKKYPDVIISFDYIHPQERAKLLSETYAVIQPSVSDVAPNLICEAVASGCPFICTQDTGIKTLIPENIGIYIETNDESIIENTIEKMLDLDFHHAQVEKIAHFKLARTYAVLAEEYQNIWKIL